MLKATLFCTIESESAVSRATLNYERTFDVIYEEVHDTDMVSVLICADDVRDSLLSDLGGADDVSKVQSVNDDKVLVTKEAAGALPVIWNNHGMMDGRHQVKGPHRVFNVTVHEREDVRNIIEGLREVGTVKLNRVTKFGHEQKLLSPQQLEVMQVAIEEGYYDWPRSITAEELAEELGIARPTLMEHHRKAEKKLLTQGISNLTDTSILTPDERAFLTGRSESVD